MNIIFHKSSPLEAELTVELVEEDYIPRVDQAIIQYRSKVNLKGFRKGQAPYGLVKKLYGPEVLLQVVMEAVSKAIQDYVHEHKLKLWGEPIMVENPLYNSTIDIQNPGDLQIKFECGLVPEVDLDQFNSVDLEGWEIKTIGEETINDAIKKLQLQYGNSIEVLQSETGDILYGMLTDNRDFEKHIYLPADLKFDNEATDLLGVQVADKRTLHIGAEQTYHLPDTSPLYKETLAFLNSLEGEYELTVEKIYRSTPAELNEAFFATILGEDKTFTLEEFKEIFKDKFISYIQNSADSLLSNNIKQAILKHVALELPESFIKKRLKSKNPTWEETLVSQFYAYMYPNLCWDLITEKLGQEHSIQVTIEEIVEFINRKARNTKSYSHLATLSKEELKKKIEKSFASGEVDQHYKEAYDLIFQEKALSILKDTLNIHTKEISVEEFNQMLDNLSKQHDNSEAEVTEIEK